MFILCFFISSTPVREPIPVFRRPVLVLQLLTSLFFFLSSLGSGQPGNTGWSSRGNGRPHDRLQRLGQDCQAQQAVDRHHLIRQSVSKKGVIFTRRHLVGQQKAECIYTRNPISFTGLSSPKLQTPAFWIGYPKLRDRHGQKSHPFILP